jgi:hypothetical protein
MRNSPFNFRSMSRLALSFSGLFCLVSLLLVPVSALATSTQAAVNRIHRRDRVHSSAHRRRISASSHRTRTKTVHISQAMRQSGSRKQSAHIYRATQRRHRAGTRASRYQVEATLDNIRTHTTPTETVAPTNGEDASTGSQMDTSRQPSLIEPGPQSATADASVVAGAIAAPANADRDMPLFNAVVPRYMPAALRGSHEVLVHQNIIADVEGLSRIQNDSQLSTMVHSGDLVALPASSALFVDSRLPLNRRYCRPWTAKFLSDLSRAHENSFGDPLQLTSAVRTVDFQRHLAHYNGNAAPTSGDTASPHLTGQAIDLGKKGMSLHEIAWMRTVLGQLQAQGKLDVEEEFEQACFHISVYKTYSPRTALPERLIASDDAAPADEAQAGDATSGVIGGVVRPVSELVQRRIAVRHARSYSTHSARHAAVVRRRRRHHAAMSLLAARMR